MKNRLAAAILIGCILVGRSQDSNSFPEVNAVLQGRAFTSDFARDVFFLQQIRQRYPQNWPSLLAVNITPDVYVFTPEKMRRFIAEVGAAAEGSDDSIACSSLASVFSDPTFYTNAPQPKVQSATVDALIKIGPRGRRALADAFSQTHYRADPESLENLADLIGQAKVSDSNFTAALAAAAFTFTATNGGSYPRCTEVAVTNLLCLTNGSEALRPHLNTNELFKDPGRFQSVMDGINAVHSESLATNLDSLATAVKTRLAGISPGPDPYRDDLLDLQKRLEQVIQNLRARTQ